MGSLTDSPMLLRERAEQIAAELTSYRRLLVHTQDILVCDVWSSLPMEMASYFEGLSYSELACLPIQDPRCKTAPESVAKLLALRELALPRVPASTSVHEMVPLPSSSPSCVRHRAVSVALQTKGERRQKKSYEIEKLTSLVAAQVCHSSASRVLDVGCGKGRLATSLADQGFDVVGLEAQEDMSATAAAATTALPCGSRQSGRVRIWHRAVVADEDVVANIDRVCNEAWPDDLDGAALVCALHACGDLSPTILRGFVGSTRLKHLVLVPCCYHLLTVDDEAEARTITCEPCEMAGDVPISVDKASARVPAVAKEAAPLAGFPLSHCFRAIGVQLSRDLRMLCTRREAAGLPPTWLESLEEGVHVEAGERPPAPMARMLQDCLFAMLVHTHYADLVPPGTRIATGGVRKHRGRSTNPRQMASVGYGATVSGGGATGPVDAALAFAAFAQDLLSRLGLPARLGVAALAAFAEQHVGGSFERAVKRLTAISAVRALLGQLAESAVLYDQLLFLQEQGMRGCELIPVFEPSRSPRNMAVVASKPDSV